MTSLAQHFDLYDNDRLSFELDPKRDAAIYVDVHGILPKVDEILQATRRAPKLLVTGEWGMGKSHTLRHLETSLLPELDASFAPVYIKLGGLNSKATFLHVYQQIIQVLLEPLEAALGELDEVARENFDGLTQDGRTVLEALRDLLLHKASVDRLGPYRMWLSGAGPTPTQTMKLGLGTRLKDSSNHADLVPILFVAARLIKAHTGMKTVLLLDESTSFRMPRGVDAMVSISEGLRELFDQNNDELGLILGMYDRGNNLPGLRLDVLQRLANRRVDLVPFSSAHEVAGFVMELGQLLSRRRLFAQDAVEWFSHRAATASFGRHSSSTGRDLSPRDLLKLLDTVCQCALREGVPAPLPLGRVKAWLPADGDR